MNSFENTPRPPVAHSRGSRADIHRIIAPQRRRNRRLVWLVAVGVVATLALIAVGVVSVGKNMAVQRWRDARDSLIIAVDQAHLAKEDAESFASSYLGAGVDDDVWEAFVSSSDVLSAELESVFSQFGYLIVVETSRGEATADSGQSGDVDEAVTTWGVSANEQVAPEPSTTDGILRAVDSLVEATSNSNKARMDVEDAVADSSFSQAQLAHANAVGSLELAIDAAVALSQTSDPAVVSEQLLQVLEDSIVSAKEVLALNAVPSESASSLQEQVRVMTSAVQTLSDPVDAIVSPRP